MSTKKYHDLCARATRITFSEPLVLIRQVCPLSIVNHSPARLNRLLNPISFPSPQGSDRDTRHAMWEKEKTLLYLSIQYSIPTKGELNPRINFELKSRRRQTLTTRLLVTTSPQNLIQYDLLILNKNKSQRWPTTTIAHPTKKSKKKSRMSPIFPTGMCDILLLSL